MESPADGAPSRHDCDFVVIGSGFGGSVCALRLAEKGYRVVVLEQGRRWSPQDLPRSNWELARWIWQPALGLRGFFSMRFFKHVIVLHGNAVGGGSITYGNTLLAPPDHVWTRGTWAGLNDWAAVMPGHFATARQMLGVTTNRQLASADARLEQMARAAGVARNFRPTEVGVFFGREGDVPGTRCDDPYFGGRGPARMACVGCGACLLGCRHGAKNTLDQNYLYLAERMGATVVAETAAADVRPLGNHDDGRDGYLVTARPTSRERRRSLQKLRCRGVVFAASSLGTQALLFDLKARGSLPGISDALGRHVRTNAESLIGVRYPGSKADLCEGIAIGSGVYIDEHTHIEAVRYPRGSDFMGLLSTVMTVARPGWTRILAWLATLMRRLATQPRRTLRALSPMGFARETMILLCMQTLDAELTMRWARRWFWPFSKTLVTRGREIPAFIPEANAFAVEAARATGGIPMTSVTEILFNIPMTAHCMGGAAMARNRAEGVCDGKNRVFGYRNMYVCDGSMLGANLGVNPSLTITALAEHAMSHVCHVSQQAWGTIGEKSRP